MSRVSSDVIFYKSFLNIGSIPAQIFINIT
jgi:hypothetical protein